MEQPNILYYDIESLPELFSVALFKPGKCVIYYLTDEKAFPDRLTREQEQQIVNEVFRCNDNLDHDTIVYLYDLRETDPFRYGVIPAASLAAIFGTPDLRENILTAGYPILKDTDVGYDEQKDHYIAGYNNLNYDMTMLSYYFSLVFMKGTGYMVNKVTPKELRDFNDELFCPDFKKYMPGRLRYSYARKQVYGNAPKVVRIGKQTLVDEGWNNDLPQHKVYQYMNSTGRHLDIARLNEKQARLALKRILGTLGYQIMEPEEGLSVQAKKKGHMTFETLKNTLAYNVSDVVQLSHLMEHKAYKGPFLLKKQMLKDYPMCVYRQKEEMITEPVLDDEGNPAKDENGNAITRASRRKLYEADVAPDKVRDKRLTVNSSSAQFAAGALCPYGELSDLECIDYNYPHPDKAKERNVPVINVIDTLEKFVNERMVPLVKSEAGQSIIDSIRAVIAMYRDLEGKDFNHSHDEWNTVYDIAKYAGVRNVIYMGPDGEPTSCFATFSIGGIHGAEYNKELYENDIKEFEKRQALFTRVKELFPDPVDLATDVNEKGKKCRRKIVVIDGVEYQPKDFLKSSYTLTRAEWKKELVEAKRPELFKLVKSKNRQDAPERWKFNEKYTYTSFGEANHEDFTSYYPRMLSQMKAFFNALMGRDPYEEIFQNKSKFGKMQEDPKYTEVEQALFKNMRNGTKLVLNSASGAADPTDMPGSARRKVSIRMNNQIIKMRTIGQMYAFMIAQAQALEGAVVPSTNTDGIYTFMDEQLNNEILFREAAITGVEMEPERLYLVSKDTNNRVEAKVTGDTKTDLLGSIKILGASGGTLACQNGPDPEKSLDHPAIQDWLVMWTLLNNALNRREMGPYDHEFGKMLLTEKAPDWPFLKKDCPDFSKRRRFLIMFQHILSSSQNMHYYTFASETPITDPMDQDIKPIPCQHHTRVFYVDPAKMPESERHRIRYMAQAYMMVKRESKTGKETAANTPSLPAITVIRDFNADDAYMDKGKIPKVKKLKGLTTTQPCLIINKDLDYANIDPSWLDLDYYDKCAQSCYHKSWENLKEGHTENDEEDENED